jgi:dihydrofolate synthase/folylpolyglutamate synthase
MAYPETIQYLESFINYEKIPAYPYKESLKLERVKDFLTIIDNPQDSLNCIHVAGTKGKGSTCAFITYILRQTGYKVGLYTSPHLSDFRERIRILWHQVPNATGTRCQMQQAPGARLDLHQVQDFEGMITQEELADLVKRLKPEIERYNQNSQYGPLSFFEIYTSLAFVYFQEKKVDFAVLETGLGGRLDATNVVNPLVVAITPISYEHTQKLGNTLREIATEKAGIIKNSCQLSAVSCQPIISAPQGDEAMEVIRERCSEVGAKLYVVDKDILYEKTRNGFSVKGIFGEYKDLKIRLLGRHQLINATVAVGVIEVLRYYNIRVGIDSIRQGLYNTIWPGRCEVVSCNPLTVLDGAQNIASIRALKETIKENFFAEGGKYKRLILVLGISNDKDIKGICQELYGLADEIILTKANNPRATKPEILAQYFNGKGVHITHNVEEAKNRASQLIRKEDLILVCGSLFVVGEFRDGKIRSQ